MLHLTETEKDVKKINGGVVEEAWKLTFKRGDGGGSMAHIQSIHRTRPHGLRAQQAGKYEHIFKTQTKVPLLLDNPNGVFAETETRQSLSF